jgi:hypothetical protein
MYLFDYIRYGFECWEGSLAEESKNAGVLPETGDGEFVEDGIDGHEGQVLEEGLRG